MSVQYKMMEKNDNLNPDEQKKKGYYPTVVRKSTTGIGKLAERAAEHCTLNRYEMEMAIKVLVETIKDELLESNHVFIEGFGTFSLMAGSREVQNPDEIRSESIFVKKVAFKCSPILVDDMRIARFVRHKEK